MLTFKVITPSDDPKMSHEEMTIKAGSFQEAEEIAQKTGLIVTSIECIGLYNNRADWENAFGPITDPRFTNSGFLDDDRKGT